MKREFAKFLPKVNNAATKKTEAAEADGAAQGKTRQQRQAERRQQNRVRPAPAETK